MNNKFILGADIGGSHISSALVDEGFRILDGSLNKGPVDPKTDGVTILKAWLDTLTKTLDSLDQDQLSGIAIAMPGPFDYTNGVSQITGVQKYEQLFGINIAEALKQALFGHLTGTIGFGATPTKTDIDIQIGFENDAACYGLGESMKEEVATYKKLIALTLGTGFGASFIADKKVLKEGTGVPANGELYGTPFKEGIAEDYISSKWLTKAYEEKTKTIQMPRQIAKKALEEQDPIAIGIFKLFGQHIGACLIPYLHAFAPEVVVIGGSIARSASLFVPAINCELEKSGLKDIVKLTVSNHTEQSAIIGAAIYLQRKIDHMQENNLTKESTTTKKTATEDTTTENKWRLSSQKLLPIQIADTNRGAEFSTAYECYPFSALEDHQIFRGYGALADWIATQDCIMIDGFIGNDWSYIREALSRVLNKNGVKVLWYEMSAFQKTAQQIDLLIRPFLGEPGAVWGTKTSLELSDFYLMDKLEAAKPITTFDKTIIIGTGAGLTDWSGPVIYFDLPKNELQYRMRAGSALNLGENPASDTLNLDYSQRYKRSYFVDWVVLGKHRRKIKNKIQVVADGQWKTDITWSFAQFIHVGLAKMTQDAFRVRPWFEAGAWGGQWLKENIPTLPQDEINYAWSFELITPENGIVFESDQLLLEVSFDWLMEYDTEAVLGKRDAARFGLEFPIRFDFLDTFEGGNLSIQCHPSRPYIQQHFGENITQDETYYILDCQPEAVVYLGFQQDIQPEKFKTVLEQSVEQNKPIRIADYVQVQPAHKHDLFLIPNGTVHSAGKNNLVLEISATPYIFTFKMYDWLSLDLQGNPRPINIDHAFQNLDFSRKGEQVATELISKPFLLKEGPGYQIISLPTHVQHFYAICRLEFDLEIFQHTLDKAHVLMLVEGRSILIRTENGVQRRFHYGETIVIPAKAISYQVINEQPTMRAKVIQAFVK